jgi:Tol biopolymer transport system component
MQVVFLDATNGSERLVLPRGTGAASGLDWIDDNASHHHEYRSGGRSPDRGVEKRRRWPKRVRILAGSVRDPVITPDGQFVGFTSMRGGDMQSAWLVSIEGGTPHEIVHRPAEIPPSVSPDGKQLLFLTPVPALKAFICDFPACRSQRFAPRYGAWMPDSKRISFTDPRDLSQIWAAPADGGPEEVLTRLPQDAGLPSHKWSHDGTRLAVARSAGSGEAVMLKGLKP